MSASPVEVWKATRRPPRTLSDDELAFAFDLFAQGPPNGNLKTIAERLDISEAQLWRELTEPRANGLYTRAKEYRAQGQVERILEATDKVERGELAPDAGRVVIGARQWLAARLDGARWGDRQPDAPRAPADAVNVEALVAQLAGMERQSGLFARLGIKLETTTLTVAAQVSTDPAPALDKPT